MLQFDFRNIVITMRAHKVFEHVILTTSFALNSIILFLKLRIILLIFIFIVGNNSVLATYSKFILDFLNLFFIFLFHIALSHMASKLFTNLAQNFLKLF